MKQEAVIKESLTYNFNKGFFLSAKIQSDVKGNKCSCGGSFSEREIFKGYDIPCCNSCGESPPKLRIRAQIINLSGETKRIEIRYNQNGERLNDVIDCLTTIKYINIEIEKGIFDVRKYESKKLKENYQFSKFIDNEYLPFHERRYINKEITKSGYRHKVGSANKLKEFYGDIDISTFKNIHIEKFRTKFEGTEATINYCLNDLRTVLNHAISLEYLSRLPNFGKVRKSRKRIKAMEYDTAIKIIEKVEDQKYKDILRLLLIYPVRPSEMRALRWNDINFIEKTIRFDEHLSEGELTAGRKSQKIGDTHGVLTLPLSATAAEIFLNLPRSINSHDFIFEGKRGFVVSDKALQRAWVKARNQAKIKITPEYKCDLYELKHACLSRLYETTDKNLKTMENLSGVSIKTLMERYVYSHEDLNQYVH